MNIFILDTNPIIAAKYHCDQHLHKMILESAQMVSTAFHSRAYDKLPAGIIPRVYRPAYQNHPCTKWVCESNHHVVFVCKLGLELDQIRLRQGFANHSSAVILYDVLRLIEHNFPYASETAIETYAEAMPLTIQIRNIPTVEKYKLYYRYKYAEWLDKGRAMTYKDRPVPEFMADLIN